jgi:hypothetical protein
VRHWSKGLVILSLTWLTGTKVWYRTYPPTHKIWSGSLFLFLFISILYFFCNSSNTDSERPSNFISNFIHFVLVNNIFENAGIPHRECNIMSLAKKKLNKKIVQHHEVEKPCMLLFGSSLGPVHRSTGPIKIITCV